MPGPGDVSDILQHHEFGLLGAENLDDVEEKGSSSSISHSLLSTGLREWLARKPTAQDVVIGYESINFCFTQGRVLVIDVPASQGPNVADEACFRKVWE